jgi:hypothetical protein
MDLGEEYDDDITLKAFTEIASDSSEIDIILNSCGEGIAKIWVKRNHFDDQIYSKLSDSAKDGIFCVIRSRRPSWLEPRAIKIEKISSDPQP